MRKLITTGLLCLVLTSVVWAEDDLPINVYPCPVATTAPKIDGKLNDAAWQAAPLVSGFTYFGKPKLVPVQTSFRVLYDHQCLYFGIHCDEPLMADLTPVTYARDQHGIFTSEAIELFVDPNHSENLYYQFAVNAAGSLYDSVRDDPLWDSHARDATFLGKNYWSLEIAIPWKDLGMTPHPGAVVGFNVCRDRYLGNERMWANWAQVKGSFHDPVRFADLVLSGTPQMIAKMGPEFRKGQRTGPIEVFGAAGFSKTTYAGLAAQGLDQLDKLIDAMAAEQKKEQDPAAAADLGKRIAGFRAQSAAMRAQAAGNLDAAAWTNLDIRLQKVTGELSQAVWDARLSALLSGI